MMGVEFQASGYKVRFGVFYGRNFLFKKKQFCCFGDPFHSMFHVSFL